MERKFKFIGKTLYFPKYHILVVGDLHLGREESLRKEGLNIPLNETQEIIKELEQTIKHIKATQGKIEQIIFLGDITHNFYFLKEEKQRLAELIHFLRKYVQENNIIFIKGNHEKNQKNQKFQDFYIFKDIIFLHGDREFLENYDKNINLIVMAHLHPTITLSDKMSIKREKYKCFLEGRYKKKNILILPSFVSHTEGVSLSEYKDEKGFDLSFIPNKELDKFHVFVCQDLGNDPLEFGTLASTK